MEGFTEVKKSIEELNVAFEEFKAANDAALDELKKKGAVDPILEEKIAKIDLAVQESSDRVLSVEKSATERLDHIEALMNRTALSPVESSLEEKQVAFMNAVATSYGRKAAFSQESLQEYRSGFDSYLRRNEKSLSPEELRALSIGSDPDGGYWVVPEVAATITATIFETSPIRELASSMSIGSKSVTMVIDDAEAGGGWLGERQTPTETATPTIREKEIVTFTSYAEPHATMEMLDDANINIEQWLAGKVSDKLARQENTAFVNGNGVGKPRGFMTYPAGTGYGQIEQVVSGAAADFTFDGLISVQNSLKEAYQRNAVWLFRRASIANVRKLKDANNQYLWQPNNQAGEAPTLLGAPVRHADDIPAVAANALAAMYGDLRAAYQIVDRHGIQVLRDALTAKPFVKFFTTKRVGGDVVNFEAIKIQKLSV